MTATFARLNGAMLDERIDATYYRPEYIANESRLRNSGLEVVPLSSLVKSGRRAVYFDTSTLEEGEAPANWLPFLTADDFGADGFCLNLNARRRVSPDFASRYPNGVLRANELLVKVKGPNQITAYNERQPDRDVLVSGTIWGALVRREAVDPHYLVTALSSTYAATARTRLRTNLNVEFLSPTDLISLDLPLPRSRDAQDYIGNKVRQAEWLRSLSTGLESIVDQRLIEVVPTIDRKPNPVSRVCAADLSTRIDNQPYRTHFVSLQKSLQKLNCDLVGSIADVSSGDPVPSGEFCDAGVPLIRIRDVGHEGFVNPETFVSSAYARNHPEAHARAGTIVIGMDGEFRAQFVLAQELPQFVNQRVAILETKDIRPELLAKWINRIEGQFQLNQWSVKTTVDHTSLDYIKAIKIPRLAEDVETKLANQLLVARSSRFYSYALQVAAKCLVEALIGGQITESVLSEAQQALSRSDRSFECAILSRLTGDGIDVTGKPRLFADLDALYAAIDESEQTQPSNGDTA